MTVDTLVLIESDFDSDNDVGNETSLPESIQTPDEDRPTTQCLEQGTKDQEDRLEGAPTTSRLEDQSLWGSVGLLTLEEDELYGTHCGTNFV